MSAVLRRRCLPALAALCILLPVLPAAQKAHAQTGKPVVHAVLFNSPVCTFCREIVENELPPILQEYGDQLVVFIVDIDTDEGETLYHSAVQVYHVSGVPLIIVADDALNGINIPKYLPDLVDRYLAQGGADWPDIPGLEEYRSAAPPTVTATAARPSNNPPPAMAPATKIPGRAAGADRPTVRGVLFVSPTCSHCHVVENEVLPPLQEQYRDQLQIAVVNVRTDSGYALYEAVFSYLGMESPGVPFLLIGDRHLIGSSEIQEQLPGLIALYLSQGGVDWPPIPGLREGLEEAGAATEIETPSASNWYGRVQANIAQDPSGNALSIAVLIGMIVSLGASVVFVRRLSPRSPSRIPAWVVPVLCLFGLGVAAYLAYVEVGRVEAVCGPVGDCNTVQQSSYARLFGILPIGVLGMFGYVAILAAWLVGRTSRGRWAALADLAVSAMAAFGFLFSIYLTFLEPFVIGASCLWCLTSAVLMTALYWLSLRPGKGALETLAPGTA
jgi:uncharacterized membrane protein/thiol-disulfide isomerase/thioredoxin